MSATSAAVTKLSRAISAKRAGRSSIPSSTDAVRRAIATASSSARGTVPVRVLRVLEGRLAAQQLGEPVAVERPAGAGAAAGAGDAGAERGVRAAGAVGVAERGKGVGEQEVPDGRRLRGLQVGVVGRQRG